MILEKTTQTIIIDNLDNSRIKKLMIIDINCRKKINIWHSI